MATACRHTAPGAADISSEGDQGGIVRDSGWTPVRRTAAARAVNIAVPIGLPFVACAVLLVENGFAESVPLTVTIGAALGVVLGLAYAWNRTSSWYSLRGHTLRVRGRGRAVVDLTQVRFARLERTGDGKLWPREALWLELEDVAGAEARIKLGDPWVRGEFDADALVTIADHLDQPSATPYRHELAEWLRDYAYRPRAEDWPVRT
jgi:hypothetical protein